MFIELHDPNPIAVNVDNIQAFWHDEEFDCTCIVMKDDYEFRVKESYKVVVQIITEALSYN